MKVICCDHCPTPVIIRQWSKKRCIFHLHRTVYEPLILWCNKWNLPAISRAQNDTVDIWQHLCLQEPVTSPRWSADSLLNNTQHESWGQRWWSLEHCHCPRQTSFQLKCFEAEGYGCVNVSRLLDFFLKSKMWYTRQNTLF